MRNRAKLIVSTVILLPFFSQVRRYFVAHSALLEEPAPPGLRHFTIRDFARRFGNCISFPGAIFGRYPPPEEWLVY